MPFSSHYDSKSVHNESCELAQDLSRTTQVIVFCLRVIKLDLRLENLGRSFTSGNPDLSNVTFISIHARRTDYQRHMSVLYNMSHVDETYFRRAIDYYSTRYHVSGDKTKKLSKSGTMLQTF